jgi:[ribosomal protein S18]-alanine N-acetyltransferase
MQVIIKPLDAATAREMLSWRYAVPYDMYNIEVENLDTEIHYFTHPDNHYFAIFDTRHKLIGHCCFFREAQVPGGDYSRDALDIGIGMRPDWTGGGHGTVVAQAVMDYAIETYHPQALRATIAAWNERAQKVCLNNGFEMVDRFTHPTTYREFVILLRELG